MSIKKKIEFYLGEFEFIYEVEDLMEFILEKSKELKKFPKKDMAEKNKVLGCVSEVFLKIDLEKNDKKMIKINAFSNSLIVKGFLVIFIDIFNNSTLSDFEKNSEKLFKNFLKKSKINENLTQTRTNTLYNIFEFTKNKIEEMKNKNVK